MLSQHTEAISRLSTMIDILHNNHDDMNYHLCNLMKSIKHIQAALNNTPQNNATPMAAPAKSHQQLH
jgi:prefoldin subunit 5